MNDLPFLTHDIGARNDPKLMDLQMDMGGQGLAIFWCLVEMLWENGGAIPANYKSIAFSLRWCKPAEVEKVVTGYNLFEVEGGYISSRSASERIRIKREKTEALSASRSNAANARWKQARCKPDANAMQPQSKCSADAKQSDASIYLSIYPSINQDNNNTPLTAADFFEIFFFGNVKDPGAEARRFVDYYEERGWKFLDGTPVTDPMRAAKDWKPQKAGRRWDDEALRWYRAVWNAAKGRVEDALDTFLCQLTNLRRKDQQLALVYRSEGAARKVSAFIGEYDLAGDYQLDYRIET